MKRSSVVLFLSCLALIVNSLGAQEKTVDSQKRAKLEVPDRVLKPFLWKIEGETPNYIFGTVHVADPRALKLHPAAERAFKAADAVFFEIDFKRAHEQTAAIALKPDEKLEDTLPPALIRRIDDRLGEYGANLRWTESGPSENPAQMSVRPVVWPLLLPQLEAQKRFGAMPLDFQLYKRALESDKTVGGLEDPGLQLLELFKMSKEEQRDFVKASLDAMDKVDAKNEDQLMRTINYYLRGDGKAFHKFFMEDLKAGSMPKPIQDKLMHGLLYARNTRIARQIKELTRAFPKRKHFFAVGTAHMLGEQNVLTELKKSGVKTTAVTE